MKRWLRFAGILVVVMFALAQQPLPGPGISGGGGSGSVTSFSAGTLSPVFTTSVATATTTPALSFSLSTAAQNAFLGGPSMGGAGAPAYRAILAADLPGITCALLPALTGDTTSSAGSCGTTTVQINGAAVPVSARFLGSNGSGQLVTETSTGDTFKGNTGGSAAASMATDYLLTWSSALGTIEANSQWISPLSGHLVNLYFTTGSTETANGNMVVTVLSCTPSAGACAGSAPAGGPTVTIAASATANVFSDTAHSAAITAGQFLDLQVVCNSTSGNCAQIKAWSFQIIQP